MPRKIYVASSWRNVFQPAIVSYLRGWGHEVYDFRNPPHGDAGFSWREIDGDWQNWTAEQYIKALASDPAQRGYRADRDGMDWADTCIVVLPCGRSAHLEAGFMAGQGKDVFVLTRDGEEPELMNLLLTGIFTDLEVLARAIGSERAA